jgi:ubiquinone biosynthesis protein Coq4
MLGMYKKYKMLRAFAAMVKDPTQTDMVFQIAELSRKDKNVVLETALTYIQNQPGVSDLYRGKYHPKLPAVGELLHLPKDTFGHRLGLHMSANNLDFGFYPVAEGTSEREYVINRVRRSHDLWHVVTGFNISVPDEIGLQAFTLAQLRSPLPATLIAGGILHALSQKPEFFPSMIDAIFHGYEMGRKCRKLVGIKLEDRLEQNIFDLRAELAIEGVQEDRAPIPIHQARSS